MDFTAIINDKISFGRYPYPPEEAVKELENNGYNIFIDLTNKKDNVIPYQQYLNTSIYFKFPIDDMSSPTNQEDVLKLITGVNKNKGKIYIHCRGGHGRAGMIAACFLKYEKYKDPLSIVWAAHQKRKCMKDKWRKMGSPQTKIQKTFVNNFLIKNNIHSLESLGLLTVSKLKDILRARKLKLSGKKADLIDRLLNPETAVIKTRKTRNPVDLVENSIKSSNLQVNQVLYTFLNTYGIGNRYGKMLALVKDVEFNKIPKKNPVMTITFGDQAENHVGMQKIGQLADEGFSVDDLKRTLGVFSKLGFKCELIDLNKNLVPKIPEMNNVESAAVLIIRNGIDCILRNMNKTSNDLLLEQLNLKWDTKAKMYGRVVNKKARHNLCYGDKSQEPDYENGKGRIVSFDSIPCTKFIKSELVKYVGNKAENLVAEGNLYYDPDACGVSFHGDFERRKVIGLRLGGTLPLHYQWYYKSKRVGNRIKLSLNHGDIYVMSSKAVGTDWKKKNSYTLRHAAGCKKFLK